MILLQRMCWNPIGWRGPAGGLLATEDSYVGETGFGHEEWNFATADLLDGMMLGYTKVTPAEANRRPDTLFQIYFFARPPTGPPVLVGRYRDARFVIGDAASDLKRRFVESELFQKRVDELAALGVPRLNPAAVHRALTDEFAVNVVIDPRKVDVFDPYIIMAPEHIGGGNPEWLRRYTHKLLTSEPRVARESTERAGVRGVEAETETVSNKILLEDAYVRFTPAENRLIRRMHNDLSNRFRRWLLSVGCTHVSAEQDRVDVSCRVGSQDCLFELKTTARQSTRHAVREALGQVLEYALYPGRAKVDLIAIVLDSVPSTHDLIWLRRLSERGLLVEVFWLVGADVHSAALTHHPLGELAASVT